jgi:hypothetical protein
MFFGDYEVFTMYLKSPDSDDKLQHAKIITKDFAEFL